MIEHLEILDEQEIHALYGLPQLEDNQRFVFFEMTDQEITAMKRFKTYPSRIYFALQLAFFKAKQQFYIFDLESVATHVEYLPKRYFPQQIIVAKGAVSKPTRLKQQKVILKLYNYRLADEDGTYNFCHRISNTNLAKILKKVNIAHLVKNKP